MIGCRVRTPPTQVAEHSEALYFHSQLTTTERSVEMYHTILLGHVASLHGSTTGTMFLGHGIPPKLSISVIVIRLVRSPPPQDAEHSENVISHSQSTETATIERRVEM